MSIGTLQILAPTLNVRPAPNTTQPPIGAFLAGATVLIVGETDGWYGIDWSGKTAYISANPKYGKLTRTSPIPEGHTTIRLTTTVNVRTAPSATAEDIGDAEADSEFEVLATVDGWYKIRWNDGYAFITASPKYHVDAAIERDARAAVPVPAPAPVPAPTLYSPLAWAPRVVTDLVAPNLEDHRPLTVEEIEAIPHPVPAFPNIPGLFTQLCLGDVRAPEVFAAADAVIKARLSGDAQADYYELLTLYTPYFSQRDNDVQQGGVAVETKGGQMCNLTSLAMCLLRQGCRVPGTLLQPEDRLEALRVAKNFGPRTTYEGWGRCAEAMGMKTRWLAPSPQVCPIAWWNGEPLSLLRQGYSLMASITGHINAVVGIRPDRIFVHDPYGTNTLGPGGAHTWGRFNTFDGKAGFTSDEVGRWLAHSEAELKDHSWNWVIAIRSAALGG